MRYFRLLTLDMDQCGIGWSAAYFAMFEMNLSLLVFRDPFHRDWNDLKLSANLGDGGMWRTISLMVVFFNINYAPWNKSDHFRTKGEVLRDRRCRETHRQS